MKEGKGVFARSGVGTSFETTGQHAGDECVTAVLSDVRKKRFEPVADTGKITGDRARLDVEGHENM